ncbi:MAG: tetratricopeptide repeat protein [Desulfobacteraceae bacterium]|jgi:tight adherence protein B|nr:MAG: tetratricopeptide repeat protein [Desulfobacteraceae bacterium]
MSESRQLAATPLTESWKPMIQKIILLMTFFSVIWGGLYLWLRGRAMVQTPMGMSNYRQWIQSSMADMFYKVSDREILYLLTGLIMLGALTGFFLPGKITQYDQFKAIERAIQHNRLDQYNEAVLALDEMKNLSSPIVQNELGVAYLGLGNFENAEKAFLRATKLMPHYSKAYQNLAVVYTITGKTAKAGFAETRAMEADKFPISRKSLYNIKDNITDQIGRRLFLAGLLALGAWQLPRLIIRFLQFRRQKKFGEQLADGLVMIANGLRAGFSLLQAFEMVAKEAKPPLSEEFDLVLREHRLGASLGDALKRMADRMPGNDTRLMVNATLILLESGGNLPERFDTLAKTMQERKRIQLKIKTMTAEGETQAYMLALLPLVLALLLNSMNNEVFRLMYTTVLGWMIIGLIVLMEVVGLIWMLKIVKVKI